MPKPRSGVIELEGARTSIYTGDDHPGQFIELYIMNFVEGVGAGIQYKVEPNVICCH